MLFNLTNIKSLEGFNKDNIEFIDGYPVEKLEVNLKWMEESKSSRKPPYLEKEWSRNKCSGSRDQEH